MYAGEVFWCETVVDMLTKVFCCEAVCLKLLYVICRFVQECFVVVYFHYVKWGGVRCVGCTESFRYVRDRAHVWGDVCGGGIH